VTLRLNLGAGSRPMAGWVNVDRMPLPGIDEVWDLDRTPWPWWANSVQAITARDIFEHVADAVEFMVECHRVLVDGGRLWIRTPNIALSPVDAFTDPTHRRFPTWQTFDYWITGTRYYAEHNQAYGGVAYQLEDRRPDDGSMVVILTKFVDPCPLTGSDQGEPHVREGEQAEGGSHAGVRQGDDTSAGDVDRAGSDGPAGGGENHRE
jgi:Methyltransferase domain